MKMVPVIILSLLAGLGCARVQVEAPKEPIKMDITMRVDLYQHVVKDIDEIESIVSGTAPAPAKKNVLADALVPEAHADELNPEVEQAALRRRDRRSQILAWESQGAIGENRSGLLAMRAQIDPEAEAVVRDENADRSVIYQALAQKNGTSVGEIEKVYAKRLQGDAPSGTPVESDNGEWTAKA